MRLHPRPLCRVCIPSLFSGSAGGRGLRCLLSPPDSAPAYSLRRRPPTLLQSLTSCQAEFELENVSAASKYLILPSRSSKFARLRPPTVSWSSARQSLEAFPPLVDDQASRSTHGNIRSLNCSVVFQVQSCQGWLRSDPRKTASPPSQPQESSDPRIHAPTTQPGKRQA